MAGLTAGRGPGGAEDQRPQQEHLPLHGLGPEVLERRGRGVVGRVVVHRVEREDPVLDVEDRGQGLGAPLRHLEDRVDEGHQHQGAQDGERPHRQQPFEHVQPVPAQHPGPAGLQLAHEEQGEEERGDQQEDADPAGDPAEEHVVHHDEQHRHGPQSLHLRAAPGVAGRSPSCGVLVPGRHGGRARGGGVDGGQGMPPRTAPRQPRCVARAGGCGREWGGGERPS